MSVVIENKVEREAYREPNLLKFDTVMPTHFDQADSRVVE
jgi:hypothetical protein